MLDDAAMLSAFLNDFHQLPGKKILIHGGGRIATDIGAKMGLQAQMVEGRRVTDEATIDLVTMVYGGLLNKQLVAKLQALGTNAIGMTGADANLIRSVKRPVKNGVDYGWVGDPVEVNDSFLKSVVDSRAVPIVAPLTHDLKGHILNTNADTMAGTVAAAMAPHFAVNLLLTFDLPGVLRDVNDPNSLIREFPQHLFSELKSAGAIHTGMIPKLENAFNALKSGVKTVRICKFSEINSDHGTFLQV